MPKRTVHNIGVYARGKLVKTYYDLIAHHGRVSESEEETRLKKGIKQIQNIVHKRLTRLERYEEKTGITPKALEQIRETGFGKGVSTKGDLQMLRESYQAGVKFLAQSSSTVKGVEAQKKAIETSLREAGWKSKKGLTSEQYSRYQALAKKFYGEEAKQAYYLRAGGRVDRETLRETANKEIVQLLNDGDIDSVLDRAQARINQMYEDIMTESEFEDEW